MICKTCKQEINAQAKYCPKCGCKIEEYNKKELASRDRLFGSVSLILFGIGLLLFDGVLAMVFNANHLNVKIPFYISTIIYFVASILSFMQIVHFSRKRKADYEVPKKATTTSYAVVILSIFVILANVNSVLMV